MSSTITPVVLDRVFERAARHDRAAFIAYVMAGDPDLTTTLSILETISTAGADLIELGLPYGDPLADGPTIASAARRALDRETRLADVFSLLKQHSEAGGAPVVLFTYFNPIYRYGIERFTREASASGAIGIIVPDLALEESSTLRACAAVHGLQMPLLVAPSTPRFRAKTIADAASGFLYVVSRLGVTGADGYTKRKQMREQIAMLRGITKKPLAVGFGISDVAAVHDVASLADGVIVGSALIDAYAGSSGAEAARRVRALATPLISATVREPAKRA
jgi:tryptophan synthase alpha chain